MSPLEAEQVAAITAWQSDPDTLRATCTPADVDALRVANYITEDLRDYALRVLARTE